MSIFRFVDEPDADRDEIAAERWTLGLLGGWLREQYPPSTTPSWPGAIGSLTGFPLVVDDNLPMGEVRVRRRPPADLDALAGLMRRFKIPQQETVEGQR